MLNHDGGMFFGGVLMWIFWLVLLGLVVWIIRAVVSGKHAGSGANHSTAESPLTILKKRYALGEIDEEEFKQRRRELEH